MTPSGIEPATFRFVEQRLNHCATVVPTVKAVPEGLFLLLWNAKIIRNFVSLYRTIILPVVLYGCETWSLTRREERKLRMFENMVLRRIFGPRSDEVTGEWRRLHNEELND